ncbi:MAG TPA: 50S ribosomal protein L32 [Patescibacteria group bacterium]|nr:50S ribosomal protein L32 [Patescibacteria group bacterium]
MPAEPKKRHSRSVKNIRRASIKLAAINLVICPNCNFKTMAHMVCRNCGSYAGKKVQDEAVKVTRA